MSVSVLPPLSRDPHEYRIFNCVFLSLCWRLIVSSLNQPFRRTSLRSASRRRPYNCGWTRTNPSSFRRLSRSRVFASPSKKRTPRSAASSERWVDRVRRRGKKISKEADAGNSSAIEAARRRRTILAAELEHRLYECDGTMRRFIGKVVTCFDREEELRLFLCACGCVLCGIVKCRLLRKNALVVDRGTP